MRLVNLGCGAVRPPDPWINVDTIDAYLQDCVDQGAMEHAAALANLRKETNYVEHDLRVLPWPFANDSIDGILASHLLEHLTAMDCQAALRECLRILKPDGILRVSVPDASVFRENYALDCKENALRLYGESIPEADPKKTFMDYALFFSDHRQVLTEDALWCHLVNAGFSRLSVRRMRARTGEGEVSEALAEHENRLSFSLVMEVVKR